MFNISSMSYYNQKYFIQILPKVNFKTMVYLKINWKTLTWEKKLCKHLKHNNN